MANRNGPEEIPHPPQVIWAGSGAEKVRPEQRRKLEETLRATVERVAGPPAGTVGGGLGLRRGQVPPVAIRNAPRNAPRTETVLLTAPGPSGTVPLPALQLGRRALNYRLLAEELRAAIEGTAIDERAVWGALIQAEGDPDAVAELRSVYRTVTNRSLEDDLRGALYGDEEWAALQLLAPLLDDDDRKVLRRLSGGSGVFEARRALEDAEKWLAVARSGIGRAEDRQDARERMREKVRAARARFDAEAREQGFTSPDDYDRAEQAFVRFFERYAWRIAMRETRDNEALVRAEARRYGADAPGRRAVSDMHKALEPARRKIAEHDAELRRIGKLTEHGWVTFEEHQEIQRVTEEVLEPRVKEARELIRALGPTYPILLDRELTSDAIAIRGLVTATEEQLRELLQGTAADRLENILDVREDLADDPERVWELPPLIWRAARRLGIPEGSVYDRIIARRMRQTDWTDVALIALGLGLGLVSAGTGLIAVAAAVGAAGVGVYQVASDVETYLFQRAAAGSAFDRAQALAAEDPSLGWLAFSIVTTAFDWIGVIEVFSRLRGPARLVMHGLEDAASLHDEAVKAARDLGHANPKAFADDVVAQANKVRLGEPLEAPALPNALADKAAATAALRTWTPDEIARFKKPLEGFTHWEGVAGRTTKRTYMVRVAEAGFGKGGGMWGAALFDSEDEARAFARWLASHPEEELRRWFAIPHQWVGGDVSKFQAVKVFEVPAGTAVLRGPVAPQLEAATRFVDVPAGASPEELLWAAERARTVPGGGPQVALDPAVRVKSTDFEIAVTKGEGTGATGAAAASSAGGPSHAAMATPPPSSGGGATGAPPVGGGPPGGLSGPGAPGAAGGPGGLGGAGPPVTRPGTPAAYRLETVRVEGPGYLPVTDPDPIAVASGANLHSVDAAWRPVKAEGWLFPEAAPRDRPAQAFVSDPVKGAATSRALPAMYHAAHLIPAQFHGTGRGVNLVPFPAEVNVGAMKTFEDMLAERLAAGEQIYLQAFVRYGDEGKIPAEIAYRVFQVRGGRLQKTDDIVFDLGGATWAH
jgi:hypothetical protein